MVSNDRSSNTGSLSILKKPKKSTIFGNESFLDISALHESFLSSESHENDDLSSSDYDSSNPYTTSSDSSLEQEKVYKNTLKKRKAAFSQKHINKKVLLADIILQNYPLSKKMLEKFHLSSFEGSLFFIFKIFANQLKDAKVLSEFFSNLLESINDDSNTEILKQLMECKITEIEELTPLILEQIKHIFILNCSLYLNASLKDDALFPLFSNILGSLKDFNYELLKIGFDVFAPVLKEKKYEILKFLIEGKKITLSISDDKEINSFLTQNNYNEINKSKTFKKILTNNMRIDLQMVILYYLSEIPDHYIVKRLLFEITLNKEQYKELLQIFIEYKLNSIAKEITKALLDSEPDIYQQINFSNNLNFSLISENLEYVWYCTSNPDFDLHHWLNNSETQNLLVNSLSFSEGKNFEFTLYFLNKIEIWHDEKLAKIVANTIYKRLETPGLENVLYTMYNPLKIVILLIEFLTNLSKKVMYNRSTLNMISMKIYNLVQLMISKVNDDKELNLLLRDTDLEERRVIYIIYENNLWEVIGMQNVENVIDILWNGSILSEFDFLSLFSVSSNLFSVYKGPNYPKKENFYFAKNPINDFQHHFTFQRVVWTYNCRIRILLDNWIMIFCLFMTVLGLENMQELRITLYNNGGLHEYNQYFESFLKQVQEIFNQYVILFFIYLINFPIKLICNIYYAKKLAIHYKFNSEDILDIIFSALSFIIIIFFKNIESFSPFEIDVWIKFIFTSFIILIVMKIFFYFKIIRMFGPWMKALWVIFQVCMKFMIIFSITVLCFSFLGYISFFNNPNQRFSSLSSSFFYLVEVSGSQFEFSDYKNYKTVFGPIYMFLYIFIINIIYMNLVIAILSFNFEAASRVGRVHFNHGLIGSIMKNEYDLTYGCLAIMPVYLSFLNLIFLFGAIFLDEEKLRKINKVLCRIGYFPLSILLLIGLISLNIALMPIYYLYNALRILFMIMKTGKSKKIPLFFQWLMIGFPMMIWQTILESYQVTLYFWFAKKLLAEENKGISNLSYHFLAKTLTEMYKKKMSICEFHQLIEFLNQEEKNTPIRILEKSSVFKNLCNIFNFKSKTSPMGFSTATPYMGNHQKYNAYDIIKHHAIRDPELLLEFLGKFSVVTREIDEISNEKKKIVILPIRNILKLMKWYNKASLRLANYQLLYDIIRKIES